jgi:hypothetical protein
MSRVSLSGNPSGTGTFTIASPNSNTDRVLNLPDASGTLLTNSGTEPGAFSTLSVAGNNISAVNSLGFRNRIINGGMVIDQRNAGASVTIGSAGNLVYTLDRWAAYCDQNSKFSVQQSTTAPTGFINSLFVTSLSAYSVGSSESFGLQQAIEGFNVADLGWGTANAQTITLSFQVRSSLTGTFGGALRNGANNRSYPFSFTINSANTFETKTITIAGDTSGTWLTNNNAGIKLWISLGAGATFSGTAGAWAAANLLQPTGSVSVVGTNGATFFITGVHLEAGSVATPFERRDYGRELIMCQRYREAVPVHFGADIAGVATLRQNYKWVEKRAAPTATLTVQFWNGSSWNNPSSSAVNVGTGGGYISVSGTSMRYVGHASTQYQGIFEAGVLILDSEL